MPLPNAIATATIEAEPQSILKRLARYDVEQLTSGSAIETVVGPSGPNEGEEATF